MFTTAIIVFREFLEAFLIAGMFLGLSKKMHLKKEREISLAIITGISLSLALITGTYLLDDRIRNLITEKNADTFEGSLLVFSGLFIGYVVLSLHRSLGKKRKEFLQHAQQRLANNLFDFSLFLTIVFLIFREGFEVALFTSGVSLLSLFLQNMIGLCIGFFFSLVAGFVVYLVYSQFPVGKVFIVTEYAIILIGSALLQNGITLLCSTDFAIRLSQFLPLPLPFLPNSESLPGQLLQGTVGLDRSFSFLRLSIMVAYIACMYLFYVKQRNSAKKTIGTTQVTPRSDSVT